MASAFEKAFAAARKAGKKQFSFGGKQYHTRTKEEEAGKSSGPMKPKPRPNRDGKPSVDSTPPGKPSGETKVAGVVARTPAAAAAAKVAGRKQKDDDASKGPRKPRARADRPEKPAPSFVEGLRMGSAERTNAKLNRDRQAAEKAAVIKAAAKKKKLTGPGGRPSSY